MLRNHSGLTGLSDFGAQRRGSAPLRVFHAGIRPGLFWASALLGLAALLLTSSRAGAQPQDPTVGDPMIASHQFMGASRRDGAVVRSGPTTGHLSVLTLRRDQEVVVVGAEPESEFLRILPPEGSICMVPRLRVDLTDGAAGTKIGRVNENCSIRAGSKINGMPGETTARLSMGELVNIVGEDSTYYHVTPPKGVFFYVHLSDLRQLREVKVSETAAGWHVAELSGDPQAPVPDAQPSNGVPFGPQQAPPETLDPEAGASDATDMSIPEVVIPTTQPAHLVEFKELDARYTEAAKLPLEEQPLEQLKQEYSAMLARADADPTMDSIVSSLQARIQTIELRQEALQDLLAVQAMREQMAKRQQSLEAENTELAERAQSAKVTVYAAVGQLMPSTLQVGGGSLFRLCDPATGRTMIYLRAEGEKAKDLGKHLEKFVGVKGQTTTDEDLKLMFIKVTEIAVVDQAQVFKSVAAEMIPPSLVQNAGAAD